MQEKIIEKLERQLQLLDTIETVEDLSDWKDKTHIFICRIYPESSRQYRLFKSISAYPPFITSSTQADIPGAVNEGKNIIQGFIEDIQAFGLPNDNQEKKLSKETRPYINIENNLSQSQHQKQNQTLCIEDILKDEIPPSKMREIQNIVNSSESKESKVEKIGDILRKTGIEVISSTLAKIIADSFGIF